jgi:hypothetical protein
MSQNQKIIVWLTPYGRTLTSWQAIKKWRCTRLASRINEIKDTHPIKTEIIYDKKKKICYAIYSLK